jgi:hypothetical protein
MDESALRNARPSPRSWPTTRWRPARAAERRGDVDLREDELAGDVHGRRPIAGRDHVYTLRLEIPTDELDDGGLVSDDQDAGGVMAIEPGA